MADATQLHLDVALELNGDTIQGTIDDRAGPLVEFNGWLELMSAFDIVCARASGAGQRSDSGVVDGA
ncbi:hypothetical protein BH20ACT17_BH20ACT17_05880 [soil metagenome]